MRATAAALCKICGSRHSPRDPHIWKDEPKRVHKIVDIPVKRVHNTDKCVHKPKERVHNKPKTTQKRVHNSNKRVHNKNDVYTIRRVSIRQFRANMAKEFNNLPVDVTRNGVVIGRIIKPGGEHGVHKANEK